MITFNDKLTIMVAMAPIDMRCSIDGLTLKIISTFEQTPQSPTLFLFHNKKGDKVKMLLWHKNGFVMLYKRLEQGRFKFPRHHDDILNISHAQLYGLLAGFDFMRMADYPELDFSHYC